jgi:hypothetical protein
LLRKGFEIAAVVGEKRPSKADRVGELVGVLATEPSGIARGKRRVSPNSQQLGDEDMYVLVEVKLDEEAVYVFFTRGSISSSGIRLRSMWCMISS